MTELRGERPELVCGLAQLPQVPGRQLQQVVPILDGRGNTVPQSVLEAIKMGIWDFEPERIESSQYDATGAMPGTDEKVAMLAERARRGLPLWHEGDRCSYDDPEEMF